MQSASASVVAWSPIMAMHGFPGKTRIAKNTMLMAPSSIGTAIRIRRSTYWTMAQLGPAQLSSGP